MVKLNAKQLRKGTRVRPSALRLRLEEGQGAAKNEVYIILEDVLDTYNVGAIFRLADAVAAKKVYLCGGTQIPPNPRIKKSSINTTELVDWEYCETAVKAINDCRRTINDIQIIAVEQAKNSQLYDKLDYHLPMALLVGNESYGVLPSTLKQVDAVVELPMFGVNVSLNVMVSLGIVLYKVLEKIDT